jgi:hypothetical protein
MAATASLGAPAPAPVLSTAEAEQLASSFIAVMDELAKVVERETEVVRLGQLTKAAELGPRKDELTRRYFADALRLQASNGNFKRIMPERLEALRRRHDTFRAQLQINLTVLATAHAISEGIVRGVSGEMARKAAPQTYGASGRPNAPSRSVAAPLTVSRVL